MVFNSLSFLQFLPIVFILYWFVVNKSLQWQNMLLLLASYYFYSCWDWRFLFLLVFSTLLDYYTGLKISGTGNRNTKKFWFWLSIGVNLGFLGVFKYYNFFALSFADALSHFGIKCSVATLHIILPVGISFYTFHGLSYLIDIYKDRIKPEKDFITYSLFVSFFPLLVAGPIERATHLLPQMKVKRTVDYAKMTDGLRQILWGLVKKVVIADSCAEYANMIFNHHTHYHGITLLAGAMFFTFQIYCDFSGYSDIAQGTARLFGIELLRNFAFPYFSRNIAEFWRRWHISLSTWFRDYLYVPLGGSKGGTWMKVRNTFIIFIVSGFWHGANWTFIIWGVVNALYILPSILLGSNRNNLDSVAQGRNWPNGKEFLSMALTFFLTMMAWIFFRSENITQAFTIIQSSFTGLFEKQGYIEILNIFVWEIGFVLPAMIVCFILMEWFGREKKYALENFVPNLNRYLKWGLYYFMIVLIFYFSGSDKQFIYFQF